MKKPLLLFFGVLLVLLPVVSRAADFGLVLDQSVGYGGAALDYTGVLLPRFTTSFGNFGSLYVSAGVVVEYPGTNVNGMLNVVPELLRTELWIFDRADLRMGRLYYSDPLGFIADGLFDGLRYTYEASVGSFSAGLWYTGLLYKSRARIAMTAEEQKSYNVKFNYDGDFWNTYFAPRRVLSALDWEHPGLGGLLRARLSLLAQFDLAETYLHSQYLTGKISLPLGAFLLDLGGSFELFESKENSDKIGMAFATEAGTSWTLSTAFGSRLSLLGRYSSGEMNSTIGAFSPLTTKSQSAILQPKVPGTTMVYLDYAARFHRTFSASLSSSYFIRNDLVTYSGYLSDAQNGRFLGNEFFGRLYWSPFSDIQLTLGGGIFLPFLGDVAPKSKSVWWADASLVISLY